MSQYPIDSAEGVYEAVNYLASGPSGLGQDFQGFSSYTDGYVTGNFRKPFTYPTQTALYVAPIALSTSEMLDDKTWKDRKSTRLNSSHSQQSRMPSSA